MIDENRYDRQCAQPFNVAPNHPVAGRYGKFVQATFRSIMIVAM